MFYLISDTHFNHRSMEQMCDRPKDFEEKIFKNLQRLKSTDTLIHLGDVCIGKDEEMHRKYIEPLLCKKILVRGNHDGKTMQWYMDHGWDFVCEKFILNMFGEMILFSHIPTLYDIAQCTVNIHGHLHDNRHRGSNEDFSLDGLRIYKLFSVEFSNYNPISLKKFIE